MKYGVLIALRRMTILWELLIAGQRGERLSPRVKGERSAISDGERVEYHSEARYRHGGGAWRERTRAVGDRDSVCLASRTRLPPS
jgi:hypothetical protein